MQKMIFNRLAIGTANWGREYNGARVSEDDQKRILDYCRKVGIDMIDTAEEYKWNYEEASDYFNIVTKATKEKIPCNDKLYACLVHNQEEFLSVFPELHKQVVMGTLPKAGVSLYEPVYLVGNIEIVQVPYSVFDRRFEDYIKKYKTGDIEIHVCSVFLRGKILEDKQISPWSCIAFCLMNPYVDRVILGADSYEQFRENLRPLEKMCAMQKDDEGLLDPRRWKNV